MNLYNSQIYVNDIHYVIGEKDWLRQFKRKAFLVTGALGWKGVFDADRGIEHTVRILRESERQN